MCVSPFPTLSQNYSSNNLFENDILKKVFLSAGTPLNIRYTVNMEACVFALKSTVLSLVVCKGQIFLQGRRVQGKWPYEGLSVLTYVRTVSDFGFFYS